VLLVLLLVLLLLLLLQLLELLFPKEACVVTLLPTSVASKSVVRVTTNVATVNVVAASVVGVIIAKGSLCYYTSTNQQSRDRGMMYPREVFFLSLTLSRVETRSFSLVQRPPPQRPLQLGAA